LPFCSIEVPISLTIKAVKVTYLFDLYEWILLPPTKRTCCIAAWHYSGHYNHCALANIDVLLLLIIKTVKVTNRFFPVWANGTFGLQLMQIQFSLTTERLSVLIILALYLPTRFSFLFLQQCNLDPHHIPSPISNINPHPDPILWTPTPSFVPFDGVPVRLVLHKS